MTSIDIEASAPHAVAPKYLAASSLLRRAGLGLFILVGGTALSVWLYDASLNANASDQDRIQRIIATPSPVNSN